MDNHRLQDLSRSSSSSSKQDLNGSLSAEHGIGIHKKGYLETTRSKEEIKLMEKLKTMFDPKNILNTERIDF